MSPEGFEHQEYDKVVPEFQDDAAEERIINNGALRGAQDRLVANFDKGVGIWGKDEAFKQEFRDALDELINIGSRNLVNVETLSPQKLAEIVGKIGNRMIEFAKEVSQEVGIVRDASAVRSAKLNLNRYFEAGNRIVFDGEEYDVARQTNNDASFTFEANVTESNRTRSLSMTYQEAGPEAQPVTLNLVEDEVFMKPLSEEPEDPLRDRIQQNRDAYRLDGVNYRIREPYEFEQFITEKLESQGYDLGSLTFEQARDASLAIVEESFTKLASTEDAVSIEGLPADYVPIDHLIMGVDPKPTCCRHFTAATIVLFEQMQFLAQREENQNISKITAFENNMGEMHHSAVAFARGNDITITDSLWLTQGMLDSPDATFTGKHANLSGLYTTLSMAPEGNPQASIFDMGSVNAMVLAMSQHQLPNTADNRMQRHLMRNREVLTQESLHTFDNLTRTATVLSASIHEFPSISEELDQMHVESILKQSEFLSMIIEDQIDNADISGAQKRILDMDRMGLELVVIPYTQALLNQKDPSSAIVEAFEEGTPDPELQLKTAKDLQIIAQNDINSTCNAILSNQTHGPLKTKALKSIRGLKRLTEPIGNAGNRIIAELIETLDKTLQLDQAQSDVVVTKTLEEFRDNLAA